MVKFQQKAIKALDKQAKNGLYESGYDILVTFDGLRCVRIPKQQFYLNPEHFKEMKSLERIMMLQGTEELIIMTPKIVIINKKLYREFAIVDKPKSYYIAESFVKDMIFTPKEYSFYYRGNMILCCINDIIIEAICELKKKTD